MTWILVWRRLPTLGSKNPPRRFKRQLLRSLRDAWYDKESVNSCSIPSDSFLHSLTTSLVPNYFTSITRNLTTTTANMPLVDALIIGAGPAGLSAALALARQLHTAVVFDSSLFRNARSAHMHTIPTWDHKDPAAFRGATRKEILERYNTISFEDCEVAKVETTSAGDFAATAADGTTFT